MARGDARIRHPDGTLNAVGGRVRSRRKQLKLTRQELVARLGTVTDGRWLADENEIYGIEVGRRSVHDLEVIALAAALECDPAWMLLGERDTDQHEGGAR